MTSPAPIFRAVGDRALLVEFGNIISREINNRIQHLDRVLASHPFDGFVESVPAYASLLIAFDPLITTHSLVENTATLLLANVTTTSQKGVKREVLICYDDEFAPDLKQLAADVGLSKEDIIAAHLGGDYSVYMYGFAPGYAYLAGVPEAIQRPRKSAAVRNVAAGSVLIAGPQCLVTTLTMPTGWWIIGRSPTKILRDDPARPFLFDVGDDVVFRRIDRATFENAL